MRLLRHLLPLVVPALAIGVIAAQDPSKFDERFKPFDKNHDGRLSRDELPEGVRQFFERIDANKDGFVAPKEAARFLGGQGKPGEVRPDPKAPRPQGRDDRKFDGRLKPFDKNGDGKLTRHELPEGLRRFFDRMDASRDGAVSPEEAARFLGGQSNKRDGVEVKPNPEAARPHGKEAADARLDPKVLAKLDAVLQGHCDAKNVAGIIALVYRNGHRGYVETFGCSDLEARTAMKDDFITELIFRLMSMTKPVIAACALTLYDEGRFGLDDPISDFLPEWKEPKVLENGKLVPAKNPITPRMLMSHSSGLYYGGNGKGNNVAAVAYQATRKKGATLKDFSEALAGEPLKFHPGEGYQYGLSIDILGRYIEAVAGKPLDEVMKEKLFTPLKMTDTDFWVPKEKIGRLAQIYRQPQPGVLERGKDRESLTEKPTTFMGGHALNGTTADYARFCEMLLGGGELDGVRVLKKETVDLMFQNHLKVPGQKYGLGGAVDGDGGYSWGGANGTQFWIDREHKLYAVFMVQTQGYRSPAYTDFRRMVNEAIVK